MSCMRKARILKGSMKDNTKKQIAPFLIFAAGCCWGCMGLFVRRFDRAGLDSMDIVLIRSVITVLLMTAFLAVYDRNLLRIRLRDIWCFLGTGILSLVFFSVCYFTEITLTSLSVAAVLLYTAPAFVMLLSCFLFGEKLTGRKLTALVMTFAGLVFVTGLAGSDKALSPKGILIGLGSGLGYALYSIFSRYALERGYHSLTITLYTFIFSAVGILPLADVKTCAGAVFSSGGMAAFALLYGVVTTAAPYILYTAGLEHTENGKASIIASVEPVVAALLGFFVFGEMLSPTKLLGVILVLGAIVLCNVKTNN